MAIGNIFKLHPIQKKRKLIRYRKLRKSLLQTILAAMCSQSETRFLIIAGITVIICYIIQVRDYIKALKAQNKEKNEKKEV
jgi:hydrogenase-4 membrane subunit HyfE